MLQKRSIEGDNAMIERRRSHKYEGPVAPTEYNGQPIIARLLIYDEDIEYISATKVSLSLKKSFFDEFVKGAYIDLMFIGEENSSSKVYRYKMVSEAEDKINMRMECEVC